LLLYLHFRTRDLFVRQRTQTINALRAHLAEHGLIVPQGLSNLAGIQRLVEKRVTDLEPLVTETARIYLEQINDLTGRIAKMETTLKQEVARSDASSRMMTMPGLGPITAMAIEAFAPTLSVFKRSRDFAVWLGLVPRQHSAGASKSWAEHRRWGNAISGGCLSSAQCR
jgi:transposase